MPLRLKSVMIKCNVSMAALGKGILKPGGKGAYSKATIFKVLDTGDLPTREKPGAFRQKVENFLVDKQEIEPCLERMGLRLSDLWDMVDEHGNTVDQGAAKGCDPEDIGKEAELLEKKALDKWGLPKDPFDRDINGVDDLFLSAETNFIFLAIKSAATSQGLMGISGHVGSGKTNALKWLLAELDKDDSICVVRPRSLDKSKITEKALADAIMQDIVGRNSASGTERRARQLERILVDKYRAGEKVAIIIDEAHMLTPKAVLLLKALYEIEDGFSKTIGIVLIGQLELEDQLLNKTNHPELEPFIARCHLTRIQGLNGSFEAYLAHKFKKIKVNLHKVITPGGLEEMQSKLVVMKDGKVVRSMAFPLIVNNIMVKAMNEAARVGEEKVTKAVVESLVW